MVFSSLAILVVIDYILVLKDYFKIYYNFKFKKNVLHILMVGRSDEYLNQSYGKPLKQTSIYSR